MEPLHDRRHPFWSALALLAAACGSGGTQHLEIRSRGEVPARDVRFDVQVGERFGLGSFSAPNVPGGRAAARALVADVPAGWLDRGSAGMRQFDLVVGGDPAAECSVIQLPGDAGGLAGNVNRWRGQMGLTPLDAAGLAALERLPVLGTEAVLIDVEGAWSGMNGGEGVAGYRLIGLIALGQGETTFVKAVGPAATMAAARADVLAFARSLRPSTPAGAGARDGG